MTQAQRYICIHGHFYQPPRENPWLEYVEKQESAHPFHDWNERVTDECYKPNSHARILDESGLLAHVVNNYESISFDFGPTLLSWLENHAPETYRLILEADAASVRARSGHGNAIAQAYNHMIMPLASFRDKVTQILWCVADFKRRFGRDPEGMWLPETAVDRETLEIMVDQGIRFTILAPRQAKRFRATAKSDWRQVNGNAIDPSRPYICRLSQGRSIALFVYDAPISQAVAFQGLLSSGEELKNRLLAAFSNDRAWPQLVHVATDGESYGHHHRFGEMALAYALKELRQHDAIQITNYGEYLERHPPTAEVEIVENSSWSCAHGVARWAEDCGCRVSHKPDWNQKWRTPLRKALDLLRDRVDAVFAEQGARLLKDPWVARNDYIELILEKRPKFGPFLEKHRSRKLNREACRTVLKLLEMQRHRMLMYTSCGWFFDDISGIETIQILRYAARVLQLAAPFAPSLRDSFLEELSNAKSNARPYYFGNELFLQKIDPQVATLSKVAAHVAIFSIFEAPPQRQRLYCYDVKILDAVRKRSGERTLLIGRVSILSRITAESQVFVFAVLHHGGVDLRCSVAESTDYALYEGAKQDLVGTFRVPSSTALIRKLDKYFPGEYFTIGDLFVDERRKILERVTRNMYEEQAGILEDFYWKSKDLAGLLMDQEAPLPDTFVAAARFVLNRATLRELEKVSAGAFPEKLESVMEEAEFWRVVPDLSAVEKVIRRRALALVEELGANPADQQKASEIIRYLNLARRLEIPLQLGEAQILFFNTGRSLSPAQRKKLPQEFVELAARLGVRLELEQ
jgi:alpha-amylase/alpha-mannosidase (GH57 family)